MKLAVLAPTLAVAVKAAGSAGFRIDTKENEPDLPEWLRRPYVSENGIPLENSPIMHLTLPADELIAITGPSLAVTLGAKEIILRNN